MRFYWLKKIILLLCLISIWNSSNTLAQETPPAPIEVEFAVDQTSIKQDETIQAVVVLRNTTGFTITQVSLQFQTMAFSPVQVADPPDNLLPFASAQASYIFAGQETGNRNLIASLEYTWTDPETTVIHHHIETIQATGLEIKPKFAFSWPDFLIPLFAGFLISQAGIWLVDKRKERRETAQRREQAIGVVLAILQAARKAVETKEPVSFDLWKEVVLKGNLYPSLHEYGRHINQLTLPQELAELPIKLDQYNDQRSHNLTDESLAALREELDRLIATIESHH